MLNNIEKEYVLRTSDFNPQEIIRSSSILDLFQDVAGYHSSFLGCGLSDFSKKGLCWVLVGVRFEKLKNFQMFSKVKVKTWPLKPSFVKFRREYLVYDENDNLLCKGDSMWTIIDMKTRKIVSLSDVYNGLMDYREEKSLTERFTKINLPKEDQFKLCGIREVTRSDLDMNGHVNNIRYANFTVDVLEEDVDSYKNFSIDYNKELLFGESVTLYRADEDGKIFIKGKYGEDLIFTAEYSD